MANTIIFENYKVRTPAANALEKLREIKNEFDDAVKEVNSANMIAVKEQREQVVKTINRVNSHITNAIDELSSIIDRPYYVLSDEDGEQEKPI